LKVLQTIYTLPAKQDTAAAEVQISHDGLFLYVSNRLTNINGTITAFSINQSTGELTTIGYTGTGGVQPRYFGLSRDGRFVLVANQFSNNIKVFPRDSKTGLIGATAVSTLEGVTAPSYIIQI